MSARDGTKVPRVPKDFGHGEGGRSPHPVSPWRTSEVETIWRHPDMTAEELHEFIPRHSVEAIKHKRARVGRYNPRQVPLCQLCGQHPVDVGDPWARSRGLCRQCALEEKDWQDRNAERLARENAARRQRKHKRGRRGGE